MALVKDLTGQRFGRLVVLSRDSRGDYISSGIRRIAWKCKCDCGGEITVIGGNLTSGMTKSCGCLRREKAAINGRNRKGKKNTWSSLLPT